MKNLQDVQEVIKNTTMKYGFNNDCPDLIEMLKKCVDEWRKAERWLIFHNRLFRKLRPLRSVVFRLRDGYEKRRFRQTRPRESETKTAETGVSPSSGDDLPGLMMAGQIMRRILT